MDKFILKKLKLNNYAHSFYHMGTESNSGELN